MFPLSTTAGGPAWIGWLGRVNPMAYAVAGVRRALYGGTPPGGGALPASAGLELAVTWTFALVAIVVAVRVCSRRGDKP
jgi:ABC-type polysaccharide/polyol phosphate export permease